MLQQLAEAEDLVLSSACVWEVVVKHGLGTLPLPVSPGRLVELSRSEAGMRPLPLTAEHVLGVAELPALHRDPFDRALVAQARASGAACPQPRRRARKAATLTRLAHDVLQ